MITGIQFKSIEELKKLKKQKNSHKTHRAVFNIEYCHSKDLHTILSYLIIDDEGNFELPSLAETVLHPHFIRNVQLSVENNKLCTRYDFPGARLWYEIVPAMVQANPNIHSVQDILDYYGTNGNSEIKKRFINEGAVWFGTPVEAVKVEVEKSRHGVKITPPKNAYTISPDFSDKELANLYIPKTVPNNIELNKIFFSGTKSATSVPEKMYNQGLVQEMEAFIGDDVNF